MWTAFTNQVAGRDRCLFKRGEAMLVQPYLFFEGRCDEAVKFYQSAVGAEILMLMRYKESPDPSMVTPATADKVMHASLRIGESVVMASDGRCTGQSTFGGFSLSLIVADDADAERKFAALTDGGQITMPLTKTFFASKFGMGVDRFGVQWMVMVGQQN
jgi:PhnB protein